jgi:hypothetical protein
MKAVITLVTIICGTLLLLSPLIGPRGIHPDYYLWAQIVGIGMSIAGIAVGFIVIAQGSRVVAPVAE